LKTNAPSSTPGAIRYPNSTTATTASPLGSHTGAMLVLTKASANDALAATAYPVARSRIRPRSYVRGANVGILRSYHSGRYRPITPTGLHKNLGGRCRIPVALFEASV
jgi:hypothetical protein